MSEKINLTGHTDDFIGWFLCEALGQHDFQKVFPDRKSLATSRTIIKTTISEDFDLEATLFEFTNRAMAAHEAQLEMAKKLKAK